MIIDNAVVIEIIGFSLASFALGYTTTMLLRIFKRAANSIR